MWLVSHQIWLRNTVLLYQPHDASSNNTHLLNRKLGDLFISCICHFYRFKLLNGTIYGLLLMFAVAIHKSGYRPLDSFKMAVWVFPTETSCSVVSENRVEDKKKKKISSRLLFNFLCENPVILLTAALAMFNINGDRQTDRLENSSRDRLRSKAKIINREKHYSQYTFHFERWALMIHSNQ